MASLEHNCETLAIALLAEQAGLAALNPTGLVHADKSTNTSADTVDRITCEAGQREVELNGRNKSEVQIWRIPLTITIRLSTNNTTTLDAYVAAVHAAFNATPSAAIITQAGSLFDGLIIVYSDEGEHAQEPDERVRSKRYDFLTKA